MRWIAPTEKDTDTATLETRLWQAADQFRANSGLTSAQYSQPVLGLIFLRFADARFIAQRAKLEKGETSSRRGSRVDEPAAYHAMTRPIFWSKLIDRLLHKIGLLKAHGIGL